MLWPMHGTGCSTDANSGKYSSTSVITVKKGVHTIYAIRISIINTFRLYIKLLAVCGKCKSRLLRKMNSAAIRQVVRVWGKRERAAFHCLINIPHVGMHSLHSLVFFAEQEARLIILHY